MNGCFLVGQLGLRRTGYFLSMTSFSFMTLHRVPHFARETFCSFSYLKSQFSPSSDFKTIRKSEKEVHSMILQLSPQGAPIPAAVEAYMVPYFISS